MGRHCSQALGCTLWYLMVPRLCRSRTCALLADHLRWWAHATTAMHTSEDIPITSHHSASSSSASAGGVMAPHGHVVGSQPQICDMLTNAEAKRVDDRAEQRRKRRMKCETNPNTT